MRIKSGIHMDPCQIIPILKSRWMSLDSAGSMIALLESLAYLLSLAGTKYIPLLNYPSSLIHFESP